MKIALFCALLLCLFLVVLGVGIWFTTHIWVAKFMVSFFCIIVGVAFGAIGIDLWRDD